MRRLTRRYIINSLDGLNLSEPIRYERYYIDDNLRIQKRDNIYQKEKLDNDNNVIAKIDISENEFLNLKERAYSEIIRDSYVFLNDNNISIKKYLGKYEGLFRVEVKFDSIDDMNSYNKEIWMGEEITNSPLAFDKNLSKLSDSDFHNELKKYIKL